VNSRDLADANVVTSALVAKGVSHSVFLLKTMPYVISMLILLFATQPFLVSRLIKHNKIPLDNM
jgi:hypothetical protein